MTTYLLLHGYSKSSNSIKDIFTKIFPSNITLIAPNIKYNIHDNSYSYELLDTLHPTKFTAVICESEGCLAGITMLNKRLISTRKLLLLNPSIPPDNWNCVLPLGIECKLYFSLQKDNMKILSYLGNNNVEISFSGSHINYKDQYIKFLNR